MSSDLEGRAQTIRQPATANLMIDSADRVPSVYPSPWNFQISKSQNTNNGFFTRIGTTEVVLEWCLPNIENGVNNTLIFDICGATGIVTNQVITFEPGFYTVETLLDTLVNMLNDLSGTTGSTFLIQQIDGYTELAIDSGEWSIASATPLSGQLDLPVGNSIQSYPISQCADLRLFRYIDFVSNDLTYNQDLKDNSTANNNRDVLCRWYMAWDQEPNYDAYGYPILMGYRKFVLRRLFNPPKQIKWNPRQPLGNMSFQVYDENGILLPTPDLGTNNWLMTLQFSEN